jgi:hypothetical protein
LCPLQLQKNNLTLLYSSSYQSRFILLPVHKYVMIVIYDYNDSGLYYETREY